MNDETKIGEPEGMLEEPAPEEGTVTLPVLEAKDLNVVHITLCGAVLQGMLAIASLITKQEVRLAVDEIALRRTARNLVREAKGIYNSPHESSEARFHATIEHVRGCIKSAAQKGVERAEAQRPPTSPIVGVDGQPLRGRK